MSMLQAIVLAIVQGLTEFLPVSSSGHLIVVPQLFGWEEQPLSFDVSLHLGTTLAVLLYFHKDFYRLITHTLSDIAGHRHHVSRYSAYGHLALMIMLGCIPAVIVGGLFNSEIEEHLRNAWLVAAMLALFGFVMLAAERWTTAESGLEKLNAPRALFIGVAQAVALIPGVSRSGITISAGMFSGLSRPTAARFSFLLSAPIIVAAGALEAPDIRHAAEQGVSNAELAVGFAVSFLVALAAIHGLLRFLASRPLHVFVWYRFAFAALIVAIMLAR